MAAEPTTVSEVAAEAAAAADNNPVNRALRQLVTRHAPTMVFAPGEQYFSDNVPAYLDVVELRDARNGRLIAGPPLTSDNLPSGPASANTYLHIPDRNDQIKSGNLNRTEIYVHALGWTHNNRRGIDLQYFFFYPYNGNGSLLLRFATLLNEDVEIPAGYHQGDWESIIVRTDENGDLVGIYATSTRREHGICPTRSSSIRAAAR
jgi:hypothetical protein